MIKPVPWYLVASISLSSKYGMGRMFQGWSLDRPITQNILTIEIGQEAHSLSKMTTPKLNLNTFEGRNFGLSISVYHRNKSYKLFPTIPPLQQAQLYFQLINSVFNFK